MTEKKIVTINSRKLDGKIHKSWEAELLEERDSLLVFVGEFEKEVRHPNLGVIRRGTISYEFYWLDRWFNIFRFHQPDGSLRNFYCNINMPPILENDVLNYVDLDLDILVWKDSSFEILDQEEFLVNASIYQYSDEIKFNVETGVLEVLELLNKREFPFNFLS